MSSYLVRIYRRVEKNPRILVGVVEEIGVNGKKAFTSLHELWDILNPGKKGESIQQTKRPKKGRSPRTSDKGIN